jgi:oligopeptide transport system substrate-binding protein
LIGPFYQDQLKKYLGVDVDLEFVDSATYSNRYTRSQFQIVGLGGWHMDWPYPDNWLPEFWGTGGSNNQGQYSNPQLDAIFKQAAAEQDDKKRLTLYDQAQKLGLDDGALLPIYEREQLVLIKPKVKDLVITGLDSVIKGDYNFYRTYIAAQ